MPTATITTKGQITIPKSIRDHLKIDRGDRVEFLVDSNGIVTIWPVTSDITQLKGMVPKPVHPVSTEEMNQAIINGGSNV